MSTSVSSVISHFPSAENGFTTTTSGSVSSGAVTVGLNSVAGYTNGEIAVFVIDPTDTSKKQTFTGTIDTAGVQVTSVVWTAGTNQTHALGATVVDYATATHISMVTKGILVAHDQTGVHKSGATYASPVFSGTATGTYTLGGTPTIGSAAYTGTQSGWVTGLTTFSTVTALGNRSYSCVINSTDLTGIVSAGMRLRTTRTVAAPTQCTSLNGTTQYYNKVTPAGMTFTDDFVVSAWVKLSSYPGTQGTIASRSNGTNGWSFNIQPSGIVRLVGYNTGTGNQSRVESYQSVPLNKWVHLSAQLDMSAFTATTTTSYVMFDGVDVPVNVGRAGTNPTALIQAGDLNVGAENALLFFPGKIAQVAIYSAKVTQATILASMNQTLSGSETSEISAYSFSNSIVDLNANANNLTANGSAVATNADSPFGGQADGTISSTLDYAIITKTAFSTNTTLTVQVPEGCTIPTSGGVSAVSYSTQKVPYLFPSQRNKWKVGYTYRQQTAGANNATFAAFTGFQLIAPAGEWDVGYNLPIYISSVASAFFNLNNVSQTGLASGTSDLSMQSVVFSSAAGTSNTTVYVKQGFSLASASTFLLYTLRASTDYGVLGAGALCELFAELALL